MSLYLQHFGFQETPFSIAPDPRFLYLSPRHREALAHLLYGLRSDGGFVLLTGEVGTGKTTTCRGVLAQTPDDTDLAFLLNPRVTALELLQSLCDELHIDYPADSTSTKVLVDRIAHHLLASHAAGRSTLLVIDEAQNLSPDVLEQVRLLTNLETDTHKLLRIILLGQPELAQVLDSPALRQLAQRITARYHLDALARREVHAYIAHRCAVAGVPRNPFSRGAMDLVARVSGGIPRRINVICDRALLGASTQQLSTVNRATMARAAAEVQGHADVAGQRRQGLAVAAALLAAIGLGLAGGWWAAQGMPDDAADPSPAVVAAPALQPSPASLPDALLPTPASTAPANPVPTDTSLPGTASDAPPDLAASQGPPTDLTGMPPDDQEPMVIGPDAAVLALVETDTRDSTLPWAALRGRPDRNLALGELFGAWGLPAPGGNEDACEVALQVGLRCIWEDSNWQDLRSLGLPAALALREADGNVRWHALTDLEQGRAWLGGGNSRQPVSMADLLSNWDGVFVALWQVPPGYRGAIGQGSTGADVAWLRQHLRRHTGDALASRNPELFDAELSVALRRFQAEQGLEADGVAGTRTWVRLYTLANAGAPHVLHP